MLYKGIVVAHLNKWEEKGLYREFSEHITGEEVLNLNLAIHGDPRFDNIKYVINDFTKVNDFDFSDMDINIIAVTDNVATKSNPRLKIALIVTLQPLMKWADSYCELMKGSPYKTKIFDNLSDAKKWVSN